MTAIAQNDAGKPFDLNRLSGPQRALLREAIVAAFTRDALDQTLQDNDPDKRLEVLAGEGRLPDQVFELILISQMEGWTDDLVAWTQRARPKHARMKGIISDLGMLNGLDNSRYLGGQPLKTVLEQTVKARSDTLDFAVWLVGLARLRGAVCRVEDPRDPRKALGTGFLVGPDLLLTNHHVLEDYICRDGAAAASDTSTLGFRFDYSIESTGENYGKTIAAAGANWLVSHAPYSTTPGDGSPDLDYALVRLASAVGEDLTEKAKRGWLELSRMVPAPKAEEVIFIAQHPKGSPLKMAVGKVTDIAAGGHIRYNTETQGGSSGAPCLDATLKLVAIHQGSNSDRPKDAPYNEGIPIDAVIDHIAASGVPAFWV